MCIFFLAGISLASARLSLSLAAADSGKRLRAYPHVTTSSPLMNTAPISAPGSSETGNVINHFFKLTQTVKWKKRDIFHEDFEIFYTFIEARLKLS
jgi:hypothetical protein